MLEIWRTNKDFDEFCYRYEHELPKKIYFSSIGNQAQNDKNADNEDFDSVSDSEQSFNCNSWIADSSMKSSIYSGPNGVYPFKLIYSKEHDHNGSMDWRMYKKGLR